MNSHSLYCECKGCCEAWDSLEDYFPDEMHIGIDEETEAEQDVFWFPILGL